MIRSITDVAELAQVAGGVSLADLRARFENNRNGSGPDGNVGSGGAVGDVTNIDFTNTTSGNRTTFGINVTASSGPRG